jgi:shikimate dehydrogenase
VRQVTLVGLIGYPLTGSLSPRMQNAAFAARGLDWAYTLVPVSRFVEDAIAGLFELGFRGANVTIPHKRAAAAVCDQADGDSVNTLLFEEGMVIGFNTDQDIVKGIDAQRVCLIGDGGAAAALRPALPGEVRQFSRRGGAWPPDASGCDLVVNATPVVADPLVEVHAGQTVVDLPYRADRGDTALVAAARAAGCDVVDGLEALVRQGAASFERWTGVAAPVDVMRAAVRP